jgi:hypothetical protein
MKLLADTSPDVLARAVEAYRRMSPDRRWRNLGEDWLAARRLHAAGYQQRHPQATPTQIRADWLRQSLREPPLAAMPDSNLTPLPFAPVLRTVLALFDRLGLGHAIGGSLASSMHGIGRMTRDADVTVEPFPGREAEFVAAFDADVFYLSEVAVRQAIRDSGTFNVLHPESGFKVDIFILKVEPFEQSAFSRRQFLTLADDPAQPIAFYTPEDTILFKFRWYRMGGEVSDQQWNDILGILRTQAERLDNGYLDEWAAKLGVSDLLARSRGDI